MKKAIVIVVGLMLLFFTSNSFGACEVETGCGDCWPNSDWCKCTAEYNSLPACNPEDDDSDCIWSWSGIAYTDFSTCISDLQPVDMMLFGKGGNCTVAICKMWMQYFGWVEYKNLGQCIVDRAAAYGGPWPGSMGDFADCESSETWIEGCECMKDAIWGE